ncbi:hypothetical protein [Actinomadura madurae]|uniref:hypothetical protein n=1 Tax=Actinomadura madurae TaxID=1993 RepID=UPI0020D24D05|nr:hypothetical protein [Actinomadura madurae]MCQ0012635.1 hypothetical protein [Actinomadura madurae]
MSTDPFPEVFAAVPDWMTKASAWTPQELRDACEDAADVISSGGDQLLYGSPPPACRRKNTDLPPEPTVEDIADALARGLGILAHAPRRRHRPAPALVRQPARRLPRPRHGPLLRHRRAGRIGRVLHPPPAGRAGHRRGAGGAGLPAGPAANRRRGGVAAAAVGGDHRPDRG